MKVKVYILNAFTNSLIGGNTAGVVLKADNLSEEEMKKIASIMGFSETVFIMASKVADFKLRFFTPNNEVDLCGHGTIAAFSLLRIKKVITSGTYTQETKSGVLNIEIKDDFSIMMEQKTPLYYEIIDKKKIAKTLNTSIDSFVDGLPIQIVSTGLKDIIIPIKNSTILKSISPNFHDIIKISSEHDVVGYHLFSLENSLNETAYCRNLAPLYGINEEAATGTSNGALSCYLYKYGKLKTHELDCILIKQGYFMESPSNILVNLKVINNEIVDVKVGGESILLDEINLKI